MPRLIYPALQGPTLTDAQRPEAVSEDRWHQPLSEPSRNFAVRRAAVAAIAAISAGAFNPTTPWSTGPATGLATSGWSQPPASNRVVLYQAKTEGFVPIAPEAVTADKWIYPWSEPVRIKPGLHASRQAFFFAEPFGLTQPEGVHVQWWQNFSLPRWSRQLSPAHQAYTTYAFLPIAAPVPDFGWFAPLADPVRVRAPLPAAARPAFTISPTALTLVEGVHIQWWQPFSTPRWERKFSAALQRAFQPQFDFTFVPPPIAPSMDSWFRSLALPVLPRSYFSTLAAWSGPIQTMQPPDIFGQPFRTVYVAAQTRTVVFLGEQG